MRTLTFILLLTFAAVSWAAEKPLSLLAQMEPTKPVNMTQAQPRMMTLYEQGYSEGHQYGKTHSGRIGWFFAGFGNLPLMWLPWAINPSHPGKPPIQAEEEFNSGYRNGYKIGWKNAHKNYYIAGTIVSSAIAAGIIVATQ
ncbi:hypothetical protein EHM69_11130 [candidate division KSB1 bacterium]|nr:MAG: hypothetical protein EHM69_11130 [candidate division KSB1 bacterium]